MLGTLLQQPNSSFDGVDHESCNALVIINLHNFQGGGSLAEQLERWNCNSEAPSASPALTASWICSR